MASNSSRVWVESDPIGPDKERDLPAPGEVRGVELFQFEFEHHIARQLAALFGAVLKPLKPPLHVLEACQRTKRPKTHCMLEAAQVRAARALLGWRQEELAKASRVGIATIQRLENRGGR